MPRFGPMLQSDTVATRSGSLGRVWSLANLPSDVARTVRGRAADGTERQRLLRGTVRLPDCSGALVSSHGLVLTAARCLGGHRESEKRAQAAVAVQPERADTLAGMYVDRLVSVDDVSARIDSVRRELHQDGDRHLGLQEAIQQVERERRVEGAEMHHVDVVAEAGGERYVAYTYRRYDDVRLVFQPDPAVTAFSHLDDLLSYPQFSWDVALLRVYDDGEPLQSASHFELDEQGARPGDPVFALGYPSRTHRIETRSQHAFRRDVTLPARRAALNAWSTHLDEYVDTSAVASPGWERQLRDAQSEQKTVTARLNALRSGYVMSRLQQQEDTLRERAEAAGIGEEVRETLDRLASLQEEKRTYADAYRGFSFLLRSRYRSATLARAVAAQQAIQNDRDLEPADLRVETDQPVAVDAALLGGHLRTLRTYAEADSTLERLRNRVGTPERIVRESVFSTPAAIQGRLDDKADLKQDPAWRVAAAITDRFVNFRDKWKSIQEEEHILLDSLSQYRHQLQEQPLTLPRSRSLRLANGRVGGYPYNGTVAPPVTTFYGLFGRFASKAGDNAATLPASWQSPAPEFRRATPLTTVADTDLMGAYGSPLLNASLQLVGLQVDTNVQAAAGAYLFLPNRMRTVSVDSRGILDGLAHIYDADALVRELTGGELTAK